MNSDMITLTDAQLKAISVDSEVKPNILCMLDLETTETVTAPVLDAETQVLLNAVLRPKNITDITVLLANDGLMRMQLSLRDEICVLLGRDGTDNQLLPRAEEDIATMVMSYFAQGGETLKRAVAFNLSQDAFLLLLAVADAYKMRYLDDLLNHNVSDITLTMDLLERAVADAYENTDLRWLLPFALYRSEDAPKIDVKTASSELAEAGILDAKGIILTEEGEAFTDDLMYRKVISDISSLYAEGSALARSHVMLIRTTQTLWAVRFGEKKDVEILSLTIDEACELMLSLLAQKDEPKDRPAQHTVKKESVPATEADVVKCTQCGHELELDAKFCVHCGEPLAQQTEEKPFFCTYCGVKLDPGTHFCTACGKPCA